jgi:uncharacterized protein YeaC (DUF1315 family)
MAKKKIGIYGKLESTANNKVEDLYIIVDNQSIHFAVKHLISNEYVAFESFISGSDANGFSQLLAYLQNNSKLMHAMYQNVHFVMNNERVLLSKKQQIKDYTIYQNELNMLFGIQSDHELLIAPLEDDKVIVSSVPDIYQTLLTRSFPTGKWSHYLGFLMQHAKDNGVYIYFFEGFYIGLIIDNNVVQFVRYFEESEDAQNVYNILNACKHYQFNPNNATIFLSGYHAENNQWAIELSTYFKEAIIEQVPQKGVIKSLQQEYPHFHFSTYFIF